MGTNEASAMGTNDLSFPLLTVSSGCSLRSRIENVERMTLVRPLGRRERRPSQPVASWRASANVSQSVVVRLWTADPSVLNPDKQFPALRFAMLREQSLNIRKF
eukprot:Selendium_serpulae@DN8169_c0_g1_i1.p2